MSHHCFIRWREVSKNKAPTKFEATMSRFRRLAEASRKELPDRQIEVDTVTTPNSLNIASSMDDPKELEKEKLEDQKRQQQFAEIRREALKWIKKNARKDFSMVGGTNPQGSMGAGGGSEGIRPVSFGGRQ